MELFTASWWVSEDIHCSYQFGTFPRHHYLILLLEDATFIFCILILRLCSISFSRALFPVFVFYSFLATSVWRFGTVHVELIPNFPFSDLKQYFNYKLSLKSIGSNQMLLFYFISNQAILSFKFT